MRRLGELGRVTGISSVYETDPVGFRDQPPFLNLAVRLRTSLSPEDLLAGLRRIEAERGRERRFRDAPRTLDLDLLLHGDAVLRAPELEVPHPRMRERAFVLVPLLEVDPDVVDPSTGERLAATPVGRSAAREAPAGVRHVMTAEELMEEGG